MSGCQCHFNQLTITFGWTGIVARRSPLFWKQPSWWFVHSDWYYPKKCQQAVHLVDQQSKSPQILHLPRSLSRKSQSWRGSHLGNLYQELIYGLVAWIWWDSLCLRVCHHHLRACVGNPAWAMWYWKYFINLQLQYWPNYTPSRTL